MPRGSTSHHVVLTDADDGNKIGLKLLRDENGTLMYNWNLRPPLQWKQNNWWNGGLQFYYDPRVPDMYGVADGIWMATAHEFSFGPKITPATFGVRNGGGELGNTNRWTATGCGIASESGAANVFNGRYSIKVTAFDTNDTVAQTLQSPTRYQGIAVKFSCWVFSDDASSPQVKLQIIESGGASTPTTTGGTVTAGTSYVEATVNVTIQSDTTGITIQLIGHSSTNLFFYFDEFTYNDATKSTQIQNPFFETASNIACVTNRGVWLWDETDDYWAIQKFHAADITGHRIWDNRLFVGLGASTAYQYSDAGDLTTWTTSDRDDDKAQFFAVGRNLSDNNWVLHKTLDPDSLKVTTNPQNDTIQWGSQVEIGQNDRSITGTYEIFGSVYVGKEDGLYVYGSTPTFSSNILGMVNVSEDLQFRAGDLPFSRGAYHQGWFYTILGDLGMWRYSSQDWQDLTSVVTSPAFTEFGGKIGAIGSDGNWLYLLMEDRTAASNSKESWIFIMREHKEGWEVHPLSKIRLNAANGFGSLINTTSRFTYLAGDISDQFITYRVQWGTKSTTPRQALLSALQTTGTWTSSYIDLGEKQTLDAITIISESFDGTNFVTAAYELDDQTSFTNIKGASSSFTTSPAQTRAFIADVTGRRIRIRLTFTGSTETSQIVVKGIILHVGRLKEWRVSVALEDNIRSLQGVPNAMAASKMISTMDTLRLSVAGAPLKFEDVDGLDSSGLPRRVFISEMTEGQLRVRAGPSGSPRYARALNLVLREAKP